MNMELLDHLDERVETVREYKYRQQMERNKRLEQRERYNEMEYSVPKLYDYEKGDYLNDCNYR